MTPLAVVRGDGTIERLGVLPSIDLRDLQANEDFDGFPVLVIADNCNQAVFNVGGWGDAHAAIRGALRLASAASQYAAHLAEYLGDELPATKRAEIPA
jgi:hypothetical protein